MARQLVCRGPEPVPERAKPSRAEPSWNRDSELGLSHSKRSHVAAMVNSWPSTEPIVAPLNNYTSTTRLAEEEPSWRGRG